MERVWAVTACLGMAGLFWSGYGKARWRRYGISPTRVAVLCLICGASQWVPSVDGIALGTVILGLAAMAAAFRLGARTGLGWFMVAAIGYALRGPLSFQAVGSGRWWLILLLGIVGVVCSRDWVQALVVSSGGVVLSEAALTLAIHPTWPLLNRSGLAVAMLSGWVGLAAAAIRMTWGRRRNFIKNRD